MSAEVGKATGDEAIVEVMARGMHESNHCASDSPDSWTPEARSALASLRSAGWEVYSSEAVMALLSEVLRRGELMGLAHVDGAYREWIAEALSLVPVRVGAEGQA